MTPQISNKEKILLVLKEMNCKVSSKDLAEFTNINVKNIGKLLKGLAVDNFISRTTEQEGRKRYTMNEILARGKKYKFKYTYEQLQKELEKQDIIEAINENIQNNQVKDLPINQEKIEIVKVKQVPKPKSIKKDIIKAEILTIIKTLAIRDLDAQRLGYKTKKELTNKLISLILKL